MTLTQIKELTKKKLIRMRELYERAGINGGTMDARLNRMTGELTKQESEEFERAAITILGDVVQALDLPADQLANYLNIPIDYSSLKYVKYKLSPLGYIVQDGSGRIPLYLEKDRFYDREAPEGNMTEIFRNISVASELALNSRFILTERGKVFVSRVKETRGKNKELTSFDL